MYLGQVPCWVRSDKFANTSSSHIPAALVGSFRLLEQRSPQHIRYNLQMSMRSVRNNLLERVEGEELPLVIVVEEFENGWEEMVKVSCCDISWNLYVRASHRR